MTHQDTKMETNKSHGGARPGSGRKSLGKKMLSTRISADVIDDLKSYCDKKGVSQAEIIEKSIVDFLKNA